jgi:hypothetical protein
MVDDAKLHQFMGQMLSDLGGAASVALVRIGDALGLYKTLHEQGPMTVPEFAAASGVNQRYLREWLSHQAASNYISSLDLIVIPSPFRALQRWRWLRSEL